MSKVIVDGNSVSITTGEEPLRGSNHLVHHAIDLIREQLSERGPSLMPGEVLTIYWRVEKAPVEQVG